jgi:flagellar motor switch protein FliG
MSNLSTTQRRDAHEVMADIFNNFDRQTEARLLAALEEENRESAEKIKQLMFTFEDLSKLDSSGVQSLLQNIEKDVLALALKGANETIRTLFLDNMSQRAGAMLKEDMESMGPVRLRDVDEAQGSMVNMAKDLAARGEILIAKGNSDDELIY